jgi:hypothetical protein
LDISLCWLSHFWDKSTVKLWKVIFIKMVYRKRVLVTEKNFDNVGAAVSRTIEIREHRRRRFLSRWR